MITSEMLNISDTYLPARNKNLELTPYDHVTLKSKIEWNPPEEVIDFIIEMIAKYQVKKILIYNLEMTITKINILIDRLKENDYEVGIVYFKERYANHQAEGVIWL